MGAATSTVADLLLDAINQIDQYTADLEAMDELREARQEYDQAVRDYEKSELNHSLCREIRKVAFNRLTAAWDKIGELANN